MMLQYKDTYIANCAIAADAEQMAKAIKQAEEHNSPSLIVGRGIKVGFGSRHGQAGIAVKCGYAPLWRHPKEGFVPRSIIPPLDSSGRIVYMGFHCLKPSILA
jgi:pyruvate/2-oxoacid:ferredoxin oxidoreductase beta subunit